MSRVSSISARASSLGNKRSTGTFTPTDTRNSTELSHTVLSRKYSVKVCSTISGVSRPTSVSFGTRRRTELFDALIDLFLREGFAHLTLDDIAARLRCSKSTLYTLADSKEQLVRAATVHFFRRATDDVEREVAGVTGARAQITAYLSAVGAALDAASDQFMADLDAFIPARDVYE